MNKLKSIFLILIGCAFAQVSRGADRLPDSLGEANYFYTSDFIKIDPATGLGSIEIRFDNQTDNFNSYQLDIYLPEGFEIVKSGRTGYDVKANNGDEDDSKTVDHIITVMYNENGGFYRITSYSPTMTYIWTGDDLLLTASVKAPDDYDYNNVVFGQIKNIKFAAGTVGHSFQDIEFELEDPISLTLASGDDEMWDREWEEGVVEFPVQFLYESDNSVADLDDSDVSFMVTPLFDGSTSDINNSFSWAANDNEGTANLQFPEPGLYDVFLNVAKGKRYIIDGKKSAFVKQANIYPSLDGLTLSYESIIEGTGTSEFTPTNDNEIIYRFEIVEGTADWYHENAKNPMVHLTEQNVEIWYRLHGLDEVADLTPDNLRKAPADPESNDYSKASDGNNIYIGKLAYAPENSTAELSFILKKNGASTPLLATDSDGKSAQIVTLRKSTNVETGIQDISGVEENEHVIYDLQGRKVQNPGPGIYIIDGRKVVVK